jgi:hypothetical protein
MIGSYASFGGLYVFMVKVLSFRMPPNVDA